MNRGDEMSPQAIAGLQPERGINAI